MDINLIINMKNKIATSIEQSKKLTELGLNAYTADMNYCNSSYKGKDYVGGWKLSLQSPQEAKSILNKTVTDWSTYWEIIPAWSLSALMDILPAGIKNYTLHIIKDNIIKRYFCSYRNKKNEVFVSTSGFNVIDAVFEMICYLKENKLL